MTIQNSLFPEWCINDTSQETQQTIKVQRQSNFGLEYCADAFFCGKYGIPQIRSYTGPYPENYVTFNEMGKAGDYSTCVTFFNEDYILERFWANPDRYIDIMKTYMCATQPDFSLKINTPFCGKWQTSIVTTLLPIKCKYVGFELSLPQAGQIQLHMISALKGMKGEAS